MPITTEDINSLQDSIQTGSFPNSETLLLADLTIGDIPTLLNAISEARDQLSSDIKDVSKSQAGDVDEWITQAKRLQDDIARCKLEARQIVQEHEQAEATRKATEEAREKVQLLEEEITFSQTLHHDLETIEEISQVMLEAERYLAQQQVTTSVDVLVSARTSIQSVSAGQARTLLEELEADLRQRSCLHMKEALDASWKSGQNQELAWIESTNAHFSHTLSTDEVPVQQLLDSLEKLDALADGCLLILKKLERFLFGFTNVESNSYPISATFDDKKLQIHLSSRKPSISVFLATFRDIFKGLRAILPKSIQGDIATQLLPNLISRIIDGWLNTAIPTEVNELSHLEALRQNVGDLISVLKSSSWPGYHELDDWVDQLPKTWSARRRMASLDAVRRAYKMSQGNTREVERIERQLVPDPSSDVKTEHNGAEEDDWNANWDDEPNDKESAEHHDKNDGEDDDAEGWDFETGSNHSDTSAWPKAANNPEENETEDAWGWGDESPKDERKLDHKALKPQNGISHRPPAQKELILKECYRITDIPDHILEAIGRDLSDADAMSKQAHDHFDSPAPKNALQQLPIVTLAMFRATAPASYSHNRSLSSMNLYNDTLYMKEKLEQYDGLQLRPNLGPTLEAMAKFARQTYGRELDVQRTILSDLMDGAQGFVSCNSDQFRDLSANAVSAVVDRIRQLYNEYKAVLGPSHLYQTIGSLTSSVIGQVIHDIEDLEDISEKESDRLVEYCQRLSSLDDLFIVTQPSIPQPQPIGDADEAEAQKVSTIALYVPNYFRFQYLAEILKSSLADIRFMWTEGGLRADFTADEVIDLIKALFAESSHRKSAINAIKGSR